MHSDTKLLAGGMVMLSLATSALVVLPRLPHDAPFELAFAALLESLRPAAVDGLCRALTCSNEQRAAVGWLVENQAALDDPAQPTLAQLKRLMAHAWFPALVALAAARYADFPDGPARRAALEQRLSQISPEAVAPPPFVTGDDLIARGVEPGPVYGAVLTELYTRQLDEQLLSRDAALDALDSLLQNNPRQVDDPPRRAGG